MNSEAQDLLKKKATESRINTEKVNRSGKQIDERTGRRED